MKTAIISDIHSNLDALSAVLERIDSLQSDRIICLGDIVGYGAEPNECVELIRRRSIPAVLGNHDQAVANNFPADDFNDSARAAVLWNRERLAKDNAEFLRGLPLTIEESDALFVHSSPDYPEEFHYLIYHSDTAGSFRSFIQPICFVGHTHRPVIFTVNGGSSSISRNVRAIVNVGSVGQPRDGDRRGCFVLFDSEQWTVEHIRVEYDVQKAREKIIAAGLPKKLGDRLLAGV
jgi:diadenosine tetraphosphatase ApaH/serine/threonine PP2A family protein phosphatase